MPEPRSPVTPVTLTLFSRPGCHLCELALEELEPRCRDAGVLLQVADVDERDDWRNRYGQRIPVLATDEQELAAWPIDWSAVASWLQGHRD